MPEARTRYPALRTLRQRGSVVLGWVGVVLGLGMAAYSAMSGEPSLILIGFMLLLAAASWVFLVHPALVVTQAGLEIENPLRRTVIPWSKVDDVSPRWSLEVWSGERSYPVWAVVSHVDRPASGSGLFAAGRLGARAAADAAAAPKPSGGVTVGGASALVETAMAEYAELVAEGDSAVVTGGAVVREWKWLELVGLLVPVLVIVLGAVL